MTADVTIAANKEFIAKLIMTGDLPPELDPSTAIKSPDEKILYWDYESIKPSPDMEYVSSALKKVCEEDEESLQGREEGNIGVMVLIYGEEDFTETYGSPYDFDIYHESYISHPHKHN